MLRQHHPTLPENRATVENETVLVRLLGGFRLEINGAAIPVPIAAQRLLAYLALHGPAGRSLVAGTLWPEVTEEHALGSLRSAIWRLNRTGLRLFDTHADRISLASSTTIDIDAFAKTATRIFDPEKEYHTGDTERILSAGELLPGWAEEWVTFEQERLRQLRLHALDALAARLTEARRFSSALAAALESVRLDPMRESAHRAVVAVHLAENNVAEAVRSFRAFRDLLVGELGIEPSREFAAMLPERATRVAQFAAD